MKGGAEMNKLGTKHFLFVAVLITLVSPVLAGAQFGSRSRDISAASEVPANLDTIARNLSNKAQDVSNIASGQRSQIPVDLYVALSSFAGSTRAYSQMAADNREGADLRSAAYRLVIQAMEIDTLLGSTGVSSLHQAWRSVQENVALLSSAYPLVYTYSGSFRDAMTRSSRTTTRAASATSGRFHWRGRVDGSDYIMLQGNQVSISHLEDKFIQDASYELPVPLPQQPVQARLTKLKGRGNVEIVRQPTAENRYTLTVLIEDRAGGDDLYEFEVVW
jgi:hypothetical protein